MVVGDLNAAVAVIDTATASLRRTVDLAAVAAHALLLVDVTTGAVRHRQDLPTAIVAGELHGSGCGLGPDALVLAVHDASQPRAYQPSEVISLNPWTGARGSGYQLSPRGLFPVIAC